MIPARFQSLAGSGRCSPLTEELITNGVAIVKGVVSPPEILLMSEKLDARFEATPFSVGPFHGARTKRFHQLLLRAPQAQALAVHPQILAAAKEILGPWCDFPEINLTQGVEIHPGAPEQIPHCDQSMWPLPKGDMELCLNVFWPFVDFTPANGATRVWPGSHLKPRDPSVPLPEPMICTMEPGDALLVLGSTVHAAGANRSSMPRRAAIISYCLGWLKAYENQSLTYSREFARSLDPELAALIGYRWHRPNLGTYDGQCPSILLGVEIPEYLATVDALSPDHERVVAAFAVAAAGVARTAEAA